MMLQRSELELTYLRHIQRQLRASYPGQLESEILTIPTRGFYDDHRLLVHCPEMQHIYDLLYPRDEKQVTRIAMDIAGEHGLRTLWCDRGRSDGTRISFANFRSKPLTTSAALLLDSHGFGATEEITTKGGFAIELSPEESERFAKRVYPHVHVSMRRGLRSGVR
jgi:hypothetical protein